MTKIVALPAVLLAFLLQVAAAKDVRSRALLQSWPAYAPTPGEAPIYEYYPQPQLPYSYSAQEPYIDTRTQSIHWGIETKGGYDILNRLATANATLRGKNIVDLVRSLDTNTALNISRASSDVLNHNIFFKTLQPDAYDPNSNLPAYVDIGNAINNNFGSMDIFQEKFREQALTLFGSGWAFLTLDPTNNYKMHIETTAGAGNPLSKKVGYSGNIPILGCDLWEHAYYLKHANLRGDFIKDWFAVINWPQVDANYKAVLAGNLNVLLLGNATASETT